MARQTGALVALNAVFESTYGTAPATGYRTVPFGPGSRIGAKRPLLENELLGFGRDPVAPVLDAVTADGEIVVPIDVENWGMWLKGAFGAPTSTGTTPKTHTFNSGGSTLPSLSIEAAYPQVPAFEMVSGCMVNSLRWQMRRSGLLTARVGLIAQGAAAPAAVTGAGTPTAYALQRFSPFNGEIKRNTVTLGNIVSADVEYMNNLDPVETIRADGKIDGIDPSIASLKGKLTARFADLTMFNDAIAGTPAELAFSYVIGANAQFTFTAHAVYLERPQITVEGPNGIEVEFDFMAAKATSPARMATAVLINTVATY
ncbi:MAG: phage tail tube protein [Pseudomonadota bacterium]